MEVRQISLATTTRTNGLVVVHLFKKFGLYFISTTKFAVSIIKSLFSFLKSFTILFWSVIKKIFSPIFLMISKKNIKSPEETRTREMVSRKKPKVKFNKLIKFMLLIVAAVAAVYFLGKFISGQPSVINKTESAEIKGAKKSGAVDKEFNFPLRNVEGEEVSNIIYTIEKVELRDEIIVKGQKATAIKGRTFLILTLKVRNEYGSAIEIDTRDYVRISINGNRNEWLAPDIHNDPVEVQAISTKYTRLGFPINDFDRSFILRVGEIDGDKEEVELDLY